MNNSSPLIVGVAYINSSKMCFSSRKISFIHTKNCTADYSMRLVYFNDMHSKYKYWTIVGQHTSTLSAMLHAP